MTDKPTTEGAQQVAHTPGPWRAKPWSTAEYGVQTAWLHPDTKKPVHIAGSIGKSDARLISAAPDLLSALERFVAEYVAMIHSGVCGSWNPEDERMVKDARAAIAKALGYD